MLTSSGGPSPSSAGLAKPSKVEVESKDRAKTIFPEKTQGLKSELNSEAAFTFTFFSLSLSLVVVSLLVLVLVLSLS